MPNLPNGTYATLSGIQTDIYGELALESLAQGVNGTGTASCSTSVTPPQPPLPPVPPPSPPTPPTPPSPPPIYRRRRRSTWAVPVASSATTSGERCLNARAGGLVETCAASGGGKK